MRGVCLKSCSAVSDCERWLLHAVHCVTMGNCRAFLRVVLTLLISFIIVSIVIPLTLVLLIPAILFQFSVVLIARLLRPDLAEIYTGNKGAFFALESVYSRPKFSLVINTVFEGSICVEKLTERVLERLLNRRNKDGSYTYARLRQHWTGFLGYIFWKWDEKFDVKNHIRLYDYNEPNLALPEVCTEADLQRVTGGLLAQPYVEGRSPWEVLVIPRYVPSKEQRNGKELSVVIVRGHHALVDGHGFVQLVRELGDEPNAIKVPLPRFPKLTVTQKLFRMIVAPLKLPYDMATQFLASLDEANSWHLVGHKLSRKYQTFFSDPVPVERIREIKNKYSVGYNAAIFAVILGGIRRLMQDAGQKIPENMACALPFPLPNHPGGLVVHAAGCVLKTSPQEESAVKRLYGISDNLLKLQDAPLAPFFSSWYADLLTHFPVPVLRLLHNKLGVTLLMTSFPGPQDPMELLGHRLVHVIPAVGHFAGKMGASAAALSYAGTQRFVLVLDCKIFSNWGTDSLPTNFARHISDEVDELLVHSGSK